MLLWIARILTIGLVSIVLLAFAAPDPTAANQPLTVGEIFGLALFPAGVTLGTVAAWRWHRSGSLVAIGGLMGFYVYNYGVSGGLPSGPWFVVMVVPALLWLWLSLLEERAGQRGR